jgi:hypothetical protein
MLLDPPTKASQETITLDVREIEPLLRGRGAGVASGAQCLAAARHPRANFSLRSERVRPSRSS